MLIIKYCGGLGNQMYEYALEIVLREKYPNAVIKADINHYHLLNEHNGFELDEVFNIEMQFASREETKRISIDFIPSSMTRKLPLSIRMKIAHNWQFKFRLINKLIYKNKRSMQMSGFHHNTFQDVVLNLNINYDWYLDGMWQNVNYFRGYESLLREKFIFKKRIETEADLKIKELINKFNSVSVHIRRGDFTKSKYDICGHSYYKNAMKLMEKKIGKNIHYFFFSDDALFVEKEYADVKNKTIIIHEKNASYIDMEMMTQCKHNIISNSTFSFWGAFLNASPTKLVIAPKFSIVDEKCAYELSVPNGWVQIDIH